MVESNIFFQTIKRLVIAIQIASLCVVGSAIVHIGIVRGWFDEPKHELKTAGLAPDGLEIKPTSLWQAPDVSTINSDERDMILYGRELIVHTAVYLGPNGKVHKISNGMNCQNCHLKAGTKLFGNNYGAVASKYPVYRNRSGSIEGFEKRVNDCIERSLNGSPLESDSREMKAMVSYLKWVGKDVSKDDAPKGLGLYQLDFLDRAADPEKGKISYASFCAGCHGKNGSGVKAPSGLEWTYPPLWGNDSYSVGAGLFRLSKFAAFIKANMPYGTTYENALLTDEEAWDIAAFVNSMPHPQKDLSRDWPDISRKPIDNPFGPYADGFTETQHKYGPFKQMLNNNQ